jgi:long-chain acyl-CoA synthetase
MTFLESIFDRLRRAGDAPVMAEIRDGQIVNYTGANLLTQVVQARRFLRAQHLNHGDRCALLAPNSIRWAALDLALMAEGIVVVPLYARQAPAELAAMLNDSSPSHIFCSDASLAAEIQKHLPSAPAVALLDSVFVDSSVPPFEPPHHHADADPLTIIYTSGTSGGPKGVILNAGNVNHMVPCTNGRLDQLMNTRDGSSSGKPDRIFHYGPFCFAASWILLLTALSRNSVLLLSTDLTKLSDELKVAEPHYFINVPIFLDRVRRKIQETVQQRGGIAAALLPRAERAFLARNGKATGSLIDSLALALASRIMFPAIRKSVVGPNLRALICGSAPLAAETQLFFMMLGIPVLQVYGLTETTAICTLDDPCRFEPGRVGPAVSGIEMKTSESGEILVRGPNIFPGYWQRPAETAKALDGGWFHTGDLGDADANGNWRITGRVKDLIILSSGHNVAPEAIENDLSKRLPEAQQVIVVGNQRSSLAVLLTVTASNGLKPAAVQDAIDAVNVGLPHYKQIRAFRILPAPFTVEDGLLTTMGKLKRDAIATRCAGEIEEMYRKKPA